MWLTTCSPISSPPIRANPAQGTGPPNSSAMDVQMAGGVGGGLEAALNGISVQVKHYVVLGTQLFVEYATRFDHHQPTLWVSGADVATRPGHEAVLGQLEMQAMDSLLQFLQHRTSL